MMLFIPMDDKTIEDNSHLYLNKESSDVILSLAEDKIPAHKSVLMSTSGYFDAMFNTEMIESNLNEVTLEESLSQQFMFVLKTAYGFTISSKELKTKPFSELFDAIIIANKYNFRKVEVIITDYFMEKLNTSHSIDFLSISETKPLDTLEKMLSLQEVYEISKSYYLNYFSDLCKTYIESKSYRGMNAYKYCYNLWC